MFPDMNYFFVCRPEQLKDQIRPYFNFYYYFEAIESQKNIFCHRDLDNYSFPLTH